MDTSNKADKAIMNSSNNNEKKYTPFTSFKQVPLKDMNVVSKIHIRSFETIPEFV